MKKENLPTESEANKYQVRSGYSLREIAGEYLAIPVSVKEGTDSQVAIMSFGGKFLWEQLQTEKTVQELVQAMTSYFEVEAGQAQDDILEFLRYLEQYDLLEK